MSTNYYLLNDAQTHVGKTSNDKFLWAHDPDGMFEYLPGDYPSIRDEYGRRYRLWEFWERIEGRTHDHSMMGMVFS